MVVENDDTYRLRHFDSSLNPLSDIAVDFKDANYTSLSEHENSTYVVSGSEKDFITISLPMDLKLQVIQIPLLELSKLH